MSSPIPPTSRGAMLDAPERLEFEALLQWLRLSFLFSAGLVLLAFGAPAVPYALAIAIATTASFVWVGLLLRYWPERLVRLQLGLRVLDCGLVYLILVNYHGFLHDAYYDSVYVLFVVAAAATHGRLGSWLLSAVAGLAVLVSRLQLIAAGAIPFQTRQLTDVAFYTGFFLVTSTSVAFLMHKSAAVVQRRESAWSAELEARNTALAEAVQLREAVLAGVSHDLRTPLTVIRIQAQLARRRASQLYEPGSEPVRKSLEQIERSAARMSRWIEGLLDVTRPDQALAAPGDAFGEPADLVRLTRELVAEHVDDSRRHRLQFVSEVPSLVGNWNAAQIERVVDNLISNAIKYSPQGGTVAVVVRASETWAEISVRDEGVGIPPADLARVFEPFQRGANVVGRIGDVGLGLAGAQRLVRQYGGSLEVESVEGQGSTFVVRLPLPPTPTASLG